MLLLKNFIIFADLQLICIFSKQTEFKFKTQKKLYVLRYIVNLNSSVNISETQVQR